MDDINYLINGQDDLAGEFYRNIPTHEEYSNYLPRYKYMMRSYLGGLNYKMGRYLTRYVYETEAEFLARLRQTPLDNHVKAVTHIYNSFLFRQKPKRMYGNIDGLPELEAFLKDCDMEGRSWDSFMRDVNLKSTIYGHCVVLIDRPDTVVGTRADELDQGIRPYTQIYTPENVLDWHWKRLSNGHYELQYVKFLEEDVRTERMASTYYIRTWTKDTITLEAYSEKTNKTEVVEQKINPIGVVPAVWVYANKSPIRGIGVSDIADIADAQNFLFSLYSEAEQLIRLTNHPTLVKDQQTEASAGAGAVITLGDTTNNETKPYLLQPNGSNLDAILKTIDQTIQSIDRMAHLEAIRAIETRQMSGIAQISEYQLLDAKLCEKAKNLELGEEQIWRMWSKWQGIEWDGEVKYPMAFHIRDKNLDMDLLQKAAATQRDSATATPDVKTVIDAKVKELLAEDEEELASMIKPQPTQTQTVHSAMNSPQDMIKHMREMVEEGFTNEQIMELHPEIKNFFGDGSEETQT